MPGFVLDDPGLVVHALESNGPPLGLFPDSKFSCQNEILLVTQADSLYGSPTASPSPSLPEGRNLARGKLWIT